MPSNDTGQPPPRGGKRGPRPCDFCGFPCPPSPVTTTHDGQRYEFCSEICRDALRENDYGNTAFHGFKRFRPGVPLLEPQLPDGMLRNSMTLVSSGVGTRGEELLTELVWYTLQQGGAAVVVTFQDAPMAVLERFFSLDWNVFPYLERGQLRLVDCFTHWMADAERMFDRMDRWNEHLDRAARDATYTVTDPTNLNSVRNALDEGVESEEMREHGIVAVDSLTEIGALVQPVQAYDFVKSLRADVAKGRFVPVFALTTRREGDDGFPHDLTYLFDGVVEMRRNDELDEGRPVNQLCVPKMTGVPTNPEWVAYEYVTNRGLVRVRPAGERETPAPGSRRRDGP